MAEKTPSYGLFVGLIDYSFCFPKQDVLWTLIGTVFFFATVISYLPQTIEIIKTRSSYGLSASSSFSQAMCLFSLTYNVISLKSTDFSGMLQHLSFKTYARFLTFLNLFCQWIFYFPCIILITIFHDRKDREKRPKNVIDQEWFGGKLFLIGAIFFPILMFSLWSFFGYQYGFDCLQIQYLGKAAGIIVSLLEFMVFIPQLATTIKIRDAGSLSTLMLKIQAPTNIANALFMWIGQGDHWSTWASSMLDGTMEFILLFLCTYYKWQKSKKQVEKTDYSALSMSLLSPVQALNV